MLHANLVIVHSVEGRLRLKLARGFHDLPAATSYILTGDIIGFSYNETLKTALVTYKNMSREQVVARICVVYAQQNSLSYVHVSENISKSNKIPTSGKIAFIAVVANTALQLMFPLSRIATIAKWCAVGSTVGSVFEHGYQEISKRGTFDPEVMSVVYLLNSVNKGQTTYAPFGVWLLTFGRHLLADTHMDVMLKIAENDDGKHEVTAMKYVSEKKKRNFIKETFHKYLCINVWGRKQF